MDEVGGEDIKMRMVGGAALAAGEDDEVSIVDSNLAAADVPIDLDFLSAQTLHDPDLQAEVLMLFSQQAASVAASIQAVDDEERRRLAHGLRGSAGGIGALAIARCAAEVEHDPADAAAATRLTHLIDEALAFIAKIAR